MQSATKHKSFAFFLLLFLSAVFVILKMNRGFSGSEEKGGLWNVIQLLFIIGGVNTLLSKDSSFRSFSCVRMYLLFFIYIWILALPQFLFSRMTISHIFGFATIPYGVMVLILFYNGSRKSDIKQYWWILMSAFVIISSILFLAMRDFRIFIGDQGALADVYYVVTLLPLILLYTPNKLKIIPFIIVFVVVSMTGKRGAFISMVLIMIIYFLFPYYDNRKEKRTRNLIVRLFVFIVVLALIAVVINSFVGIYNLNIFDRLGRMEEDGGSGRIGRWSFIINAISQDTGLFQFFFGHGYGSTFKIVGGHAHNDFIEFFYDYGIIALVLFVGFFISIIIEAIRMYKNKYIYARDFMGSISIALCMSIFSFYAIDCTHITCSSICFGLILADWYKCKHKRDDDEIEN